MRIDVVTIFPGFLTPLRQSLLGKAIDAGLVDVDVHDLRDWTTDVHRTVDDAPYGGGPGMVMRPEPWAGALARVAGPDACLVVPTPAGAPFRQPLARELAGRPHLVFACGRYEGIDQRVLDAAAERMPVYEISLGDYVIAGGEAAALVIIEAVTRLLPGVVGNAGSVADDSFVAGLLEAPVYTRPQVWDGRAVPAMLRSGDHAAITRYRRDESLRRTARRRPDLIAELAPDALDDHDRSVLRSAADRDSPGGCT
ncbi:MAG: tRNA (guanosine(37)-N1)-methyltransferase TrmD [Mycobacteriales bacterium]